MYYKAVVVKWSTKVKVAEVAAATTIRETIVNRTYHRTQLKPTRYLFTNLYQHYLDLFLLGVSRYGAISRGANKTIVTTTHLIWHCFFIISVAGSSREYCKIGRDTEYPVWPYISYIHVQTSIHSGLHTDRNTGIRVQYLGYALNSRFSYQIVDNNCLSDEKDNRNGFPFLFKRYVSLTVKINTCKRHLVPGNINSHLWRLHLNNKKNIIYY